MSPVTTVGAMPRALLAKRLAQGLHLQTGPFITCVRTSIDVVVDGIARLYADYPVSDAGYADFRLTLAPPAGPAPLVPAPGMRRVRPAFPFSAHAPRACLCHVRVDDELVHFQPRQSLPDYSRCRGRARRPGGHPASAPRLGQEHPVRHPGQCRLAPAVR